MTEFLKLTIEERIFALSYICPAFFRNLWWKTFSVKIQVTEILKQKNILPLTKILSWQIKKLDAVYVAILRVEHWEIDTENLDKTRKAFFSSGNGKQELHYLLVMLISYLYTAYSFYFCSSVGCSWGSKAKCHL